MRFQIFLTSFIFTFLSFSKENIQINAWASKFNMLSNFEISCCDHFVYLTVKNSLGNPVNGVTVKYKLCIDGGCTDTLYGAAKTDSEGKSEIWWRYSCDICTIYLNGVEYNGPFLNGISYELII